MSDTPTVLQALSAVMDEVQSVGKTDRNVQQNYSFRGVDAVVNAVGPVLRKYGVIVVPTSVESSSEHYETSKGTNMKAVTLKVSYRFYGPAGDYVEAVVCGEASDAADKATPKAHSVAYRTLLLQALCIPTDEPDPDSHYEERGRNRTESSGDGQTSVQEGAAASSSDSKKTEPVLLKRLEDCVAALKLANPDEAWREKVVEWSWKIGGEEKPSNLKKAELASLVSEVERWLALAQPRDPEEVFGR